MQAEAVTGGKFSYRCRTKGNHLKGLKDCYLKAKAGIGP